MLAYLPLQRWSSVAIAIVAIIVFWIRTGKPPTWGILKSKIQQAGEVVDGAGKDVWEQVRIGLFACYKYRH